MKSVINRVQEERRRQDQKWGEQNHNAVEWISILTEEVGEAAREAVDFHFANGDVEVKIKAGQSLQAQRVENLKKELIQAAAVAIQAVESIERQQSLQSQTNGLNMYNIRFGGEQYWISARNTIEALQTMISEICVNINDFDNDDSIEIVPPGEWHKLRIVDTEAIVKDGEEPPLIETVAEWMSTATGPAFIASTDY